MSSFTIPYTLTGDPTIDPSKIDNNNAAIASILNGGLTEDNFASGTKFTNAFLTNAYLPQFVQFTIIPGKWSGGTTNDYLAFAPIPMLGSDTYTVQGYSWVNSDVGSQDGSFSIEWGQFAAGTWSVITTIKSATTMAAQSGVNDSIGAAGGALNVDITLDASNYRFIAIKMTAKGTNVLSAATNYMNIGLVLKRKNGLTTF